MDVPLVLPRSAPSTSWTAQSQARRSVRRWSLPLLAVLGGLWAALCFGRDLDEMPFAGGCVVAVGAGFLAAGGAVAAKPGRRRAGVLLGVAGLLWPVNTLGGWDVGVMPVARGIVEGLFWTVLAAAVLLYQHPRLARPERVFLTLALAHFVGDQVLWDVFTRPEWAGFPADVWWPAPFADPGTSAVLGVALTALDPLFALAFVALVFQRRRRDAALDRYSFTPVAVAIAVAAVAAGAAWATYGRTTVVIALALLPLPPAFLYGASRLSRLRVRLGEALDSGGEDVGAVLQGVLRDPTLVVRFWSPERTGWVTEAGLPCEPSDDRPERWRIPVQRRDGRNTAEVETVAPSATARRSVESAVRLAGAAIENAGLRAQVQAQLEASRRAHARTVEVGLAERRNLERDLHDGAQQYLHGVMLTLARARRAVDADPERAATLLDDARGDVRQALEELRGLAHGLRPGVLLRDGLGAAIEEVAGRVGLPVTVDVAASGTVDDDAAIYFVVSEALTNAAKHGGADRVWVRVAEDGDGMSVDVRDDGVGGADPLGSGIRGMADRVVGRGGTFALRSDEGRGTWVHAHLPRP